MSYKKQSQGRLVNFDVAGTTVVCEVRETSRPLEWRDLFFVSRWSQTRRVWEMGHALRRRQIGAARPLLYIQLRGAQVSELVVVEAGVGLVTLDGFLAQQFPRLSPSERSGWIDQMLRRLATQLARLHQFSLVHGQLSARNVLVGAEPGDTRVQITAVEHVVQKGRIKTRDLVLELASLEASLMSVPKSSPRIGSHFSGPAWGLSIAPRRGEFGKASKSELLGPHSRRSRVPPHGSRRPKTAPAQAAESSWLPSVGKLKREGSECDRAGRCMALSSS